MNKTEYRSEVKRANVRIFYLLISNAVLALCVLLSGWFILTRISDTKQIFIPSNIYKPFSLHSGFYSDEYYRQVAEYFVLLAENYVPQNYQNLITRFLKYAKPESFGMLKKQFQLQYRIIEKRNSSQAFYIKSTIVRGNVVAVTGIRRTYVGSKIVTESPDAFLVTIETRKDGMITINDYKRAENPDNPFDDKS